MVGKKMVGAKSAVYMIYEFHFGFFLVLRFQSKRMKSGRQEDNEMEKETKRKERTNGTRETKSQILQWACSSIDTA